MASSTIRRHSRDDPREDVGEDVGVGVRVGVVECSTDTDFLARILARKSRVSDVRMYRRVWRVGV